MSYGVSLADLFRMGALYTDKILRGSKPENLPNAQPVNALTVTTILLSGVALFAGGNLSPGIREDRSNRWVIGALLARSLGTPVASPLGVRVTRHVTSSALTKSASALTKSEHSRPIDFELRGRMCVRRRMHPAKVSARI
jgi:hypothetical protein